MIQNLILSLGLSFAIGLNGAKDNHDNFINNDIPNNVVYDDNNYQITLSVNELNNYTWVNLNTQLLEYTNELNSTSTSINYDFETYDFDTFDNSSTLNYAFIRYSLDELNLIQFNLGYDENFAENEPYCFSLIYNDNEIDFEYDITWNLNSTIYDDIKNAIELDIQANSTPSMSDFLTILNDIVSLLTGGLINMGTGLGNGLNSIVTSLAIENGGMSIFLAVIGIFGGIALAVGLTRRIFSWIESLGARR